ncbi:IS5 family transposase [Arthrobacter sp. I2-34]|uniref:IS5 family transposase n=1 Tax=Arthrobacter hankyongi TaxID=2904801 RepID=A0ABS9LE55_9MICC|nr:IS5 family transposase [Arthrobacter hankyongi]MCG2624976.1 IS5 family transposase [Arthrobacter hankyongi]
MADSSPRPYPSDLTDAQWALIEPLVPVKTGGRPAVHSRRRIVDAILYVDRTGCAWRMMPHDFPPWDTVYWYFQRWNADGTTEAIHDTLRGALRQAAGREAAASAGIIDAQTVRAADTVGADSRGYDAGKRTNGRKRHIVTDTIGLLVVVLVTAASLQDRDGARPVLEKARAKMPSIVQVWADGGYAGKLVESVRALLGISLEIVRKPEGLHTFEVLPRRWVIERTLSWLVRCRRLGRDYERLPAHAEAMVRWAMIGLMVRRLAPAPGRRPWQTGAAA